MFSSAYYIIIECIYNLEEKKSVKEIHRKRFKLMKEFSN